jgi:ABC-type Co2+ transport system permease subunit
MKRLHFRRPLTSPLVNFIYGAAFTAVLEAAFYILRDPKSARYIAIGVLAGIGALAGIIIALLSLSFSADDDYPGDDQHWRGGA